MQRADLNILFKLSPHTLQNVYYDLNKHLLTAQFSLTSRTDGILFIKYQKSKFLH